MLSLGRWPADVDACDLVVVDEAHAFRNPATRRHRSLAWLCRSARVVLLTATPINNSLMDLYFLFRLFIGDGALDDLGVPDLRAAFRAAVDAGGPVRPPLDAAIDALTVRTRSSSGVRAATGDARDGPSRVRPAPVRYDLDVGGEGVRGIIDGIRRLDLAAYSVSQAGRPPAGGELLRFGLVKRLESSTVAFSTSARAVRRYLEAFADAARVGFWLSPASRRAFAAGDPGQLLLAPLALPRLPSGCDPDRLAASALADAGLLREMVDRASERFACDRKAQALETLLADRLAGHKVLVFTEFRDTAIHLWKVLRRHFRVGLIHGARALLGDQPAGRLDVVRRFAPLANGASPDPVERVDILIATDVLAEGFNLQDAADVVSYDLPWNPVRLIQRVGRIDRAGSPHRTVRCHNFLPDRTLDLYLGLVDRIGAKLETIRAGPGRTSLDRAFGSDANRGARRYPTSSAGNGSSVASSIRGPRPAGALVARARTAPLAVRSTALFRRLESEDPGLFDEFESAADPIAGLGVPVVPGPGPGKPGPPVDTPASGWIVAIGSADGTVRLLRVRAGNGRPMVRQDQLRSMRLLDAIRSGRTDARSFVPRARSGQPLDGGGADDRSAGCRAVAAAIAAIDSASFRPPGPTGRRAFLIRRLLRLVAKEPGRPDPRLVARVDRIVAVMREGMRAGVETAAESAVALAAADRGWRPGRLRLLVTALESAFAYGPDHQNTNGGSAIMSAPEVTAVFEVNPATSVARRT
jgi:hypothetical protein